MEDRFYTIEQVAEMLGMHHKTIRKFITEGKLNAGKVGKQWRISGHDLSVFLEKNGQKVANKPSETGKDLHFSTSAETHDSAGRISVSTVVDIDDVDMDEYSRISGMLLAVMNSNDSTMRNSTMNLKHEKEEKKLRIMLWGSVKYIQDMLASISVLVQNREL